MLGWGICAPQGFPSSFGGVLLVNYPPLLQQASPFLQLPDVRGADWGWGGKAWTPQGCSTLLKLINIILMTPRVPGPPAPPHNVSGALQTSPAPGALLGGIRRFWGVNLHDLYEYFPTGAEVARLRAGEPLPACFPWVSGHPPPKIPPFRAENPPGSAQINAPPATPAARNSPSLLSSLKTKEISSKRMFFLK